MKFRLGNLDLSAPTRVSVASPQKQATMEIPFGQDFFVNLGPGLKSFEWEGTISRAEGGMPAALAVDRLKALGEAVVFGIGESSWKVHILEFDARPQRGEHVEYSIRLTEAGEEHVVVSQPQAEMAGIDNLDAIIAGLKARQALFSYRGCQQRIYDAMLAAIEGMAKVKDLVRDVRRLAELPATTLAALRATLGILGKQFQSIEAEVLGVLNAPGQALQEGGALWADVLGYLRAALRWLGVLDAAAATIPAGERRYIVQEEDTLMSIAVKFYGDRSGWERIAVANEVWSPDDLLVGTEIVIPGSDG